MRFVPPLLVGSVQDALSADPRTTCLNIEIEQSGYNIALSGQVPSLQARLAIEAIVGEVPGIQMIDTGELVVAPPYSEYIVEQGDSLESIAQKFYQDASLWHLLYEANKNRILIPLQAGDILIIPPADAELGGLPYIDCQTRLGQ